MFSKNPGYDACDMGRGKAVSSCCNPLLILPCHPYVNAGNTEFDGGLGIVIKTIWILLLLLMRGDRDVRCIHVWKTANWTVVCGLSLHDTLPASSVTSIPNSGSSGYRV